MFSLLVVELELQTAVFAMVWADDLAEPKCANNQWFK